MALLSFRYIIFYPTRILKAKSDYILNDYMKMKEEIKQPWQSP